MILLAFIALTILAVITIAAFAWGYATGLKAGTMIQNAHYAVAYKQVLSISTDENKQRLNDMAAAQISILKAGADAAERSAFSKFEGKPQA